MLSPVVENFINGYIQSVWQLEMLLYIRARADSLRSFDLANALYTSPDAVEQALQYFTKRGLLKRAEFDHSEYVYAPSSQALKDSVEQTAMAYSQKKVAIIQYIFSHTNVSKQSKPSAVSQNYLDLQHQADGAE